MMKADGLRLLAAIVMVCLAGGCGEDPPPPAYSSSSGRFFGSPGDGAESVRVSIDAVETAMRDAAGTLRTQEETPQDGVRELQSCGTPPTAAAQVYAYARVVGGAGSLTQRLESASERLQAAGWEEVGRRLAGERPAIGLTKGPAQLVLARDVRRDGDAFSFTVGGPCYRIENDAEGVSFVTRELDLRG